MKKYVLDSYSLLCYLEGEKNSEIVTDILKDGVNGRSELYMNIVNWGEVYYIILREKGVNAAELYLKLIENYPIEIVNLDKKLTLEAATLKANNKMSYADAFAAALSISKKAKLVTGNKEFSVLEKQINIVWL